MALIKVFDTQMWVKHCLSVWREDDDDSVALAYRVQLIGSCATASPASVASAAHCGRYPAQNEGL